MYRPNLRERTVGVFAENFDRAYKSSLRRRKQVTTIDVKRECRIRRFEAPVLSHASLTVFLPLPQYVSFYLGTGVNFKLVAIYIGFQNTLITLTVSLIIFCVNGFAVRHHVYDLWLFTWKQYSNKERPDTSVSRSNVCYGANYISCRMYRRYRDL